MFGPELVGPNLEINFVNSLEANFSTISRLGKIFAKTTLVL